MSNHEIDVSYHGAIKLGEDVVCDGFVDGYKYRVQTHIHSDHMVHFNKSKGFQTILMSEPTKALIELQHYDVRRRENVLSLSMKEVFHDSDTGLDIVTKSSTHMLGALQVAVTTKEGESFGYSGDFSWPLEDVINVKKLVVDSTYGSPDSVRKYSQEDANLFFREKISERINNGPIIIKASRGTLHRALELLDGLVNCPVITSKKKIADASVFEKYGYCFCPLLELENLEVRQLRREGPYIELYYIGEQVPYARDDVTTINLTASWVHGKEPYVELSDSSYQVAITDHADFNETLEYIKATGAKTVLTDGTRDGTGGNKAVQLAEAITNRLGITATPAQPEVSREWGV
ncbi:hypothetical protein ACFLX6_00355 [Chloroflexota bacterium]